MDPAALNIPAVVVAALATFLIGGAWYSPALFGKRWQSLMNLRDEDLQSGLARVFGLSLLAALVMSLNLAMFLGPEATVGFGVAAGVAAGFGWVAMAMGVTYLFGRRPLALFLIDGGYHVLSFTVMGAILGAWH